MAEHEASQQRKGWYDRYYPLLGAIALLLTVAATAYLVTFYIQHGALFYRDVSLTGGTILTVSSEIADISQLQAALPEDVVVRRLSNLQTGRQVGFSVETPLTPEEIRPLVEKAIGFPLTEDNSSVEFSGPSLGQSFYRELQWAMILAFLLMAVTVFVLFRTFIPSLAVVQAAFTDIAVSMAVINIIEFKISGAGIAAFLMLIGYSVDTDILLTNWVLRRQGEGTVNSRIKAAFVTGMTMTITALISVVAGLLIVRNLSSVLSEIFIVLSIGLVVDMLATWFGNAAILKYYCKKKEIQ